MTEITQELLDATKDLAKSIQTEMNRLETEWPDDLITCELAAIIIFKNNKLTEARMTELAEVKKELYSLKASIQMAANDFQTKALGQTDSNGIIKLNP